MTVSGMHPGLLNPAWGTRREGAPKQGKKGSPETAGSGQSHLEGGRLVLHHWGWTNPVSKQLDQSSQNGGLAQ